MSADSLVGGSGGVAVALGAGLAFGFVNSLHCIGMCGPLAAAMHAGGGAASGGASGGGLAAVFGYHGARALSYGTLGAIAGLLGGAIHAEALHGYGAILAFAAAFVMLAFAFFPKGIFARRTPRLNRAVASVVQFGRSLEPLWRSVALGLVTPLLPCGLLYAAIVLAVATADPLAGVATMTGFALGAAPALAFATWNFDKLRVRIGARAAQRLGQAVVVVAALLLAWRGYAEWTAGPAACCGGG